MILVFGFVSNNSRNIHNKNAVNGRADWNEEREKMGASGWLQKDFQIELLRLIWIHRYCSSWWALTGTRAHCGVSECLCVYESVLFILFNYIDKKEVALNSFIWVPVIRQPEHNVFLEEK